MKKKSIADPVISPEIAEMAKKSLEPEHNAIVKCCVVCGSSSTPLTGPQSSEEDLCWVCRRLKISAWRETSDQQATTQE